MDENEEQNLDCEYKRYLEILRPYLGQLLDQDVIEICNAWIQRLSHCSKDEKVLRNKYIFNLCYQLARGILEEPFLEIPPSDELAPLLDGTNTEHSANASTEVECLVLDLENPNIKVLYNKQNNSATENLSRASEFDLDRSDDLDIGSKNSTSSSNKESCPKHKQILAWYRGPNMLPAYKNFEICNDNYEHRANKLIIKLREIKQQNFMLQNELMALKDESRRKPEFDESRENILKIDNATSTYYVRAQESNTTINSLKSKLQELQESRNGLIEIMSDLRDKLDNFNEIKRHEIENLIVQHKLEVMQVKTSIREEMKTNYEKNVLEIKEKNEQFIKDIQNLHLKEIDDFKTNTEVLISEKDKIIQSKEIEITQLKNYIEELKSNQYSLFSKFLEHPNNDISSKCTQKAEELQKRLDKMEKCKIKYSKIYDAKMASLQREKYMAECSLQLQLVKQRTQVINETADEHQTELATALDKLEGKYKDIVASVQATAVQRRIQDQMALESIIQTVCGIRNEALQCNNAQGTYTTQLSNKAMRNQARDSNHCCDNEMPTVARDNKVGSVIVGNKSFGDDIAVNGYCLDGEKFGELFERVCIPQRDTGDNSHKK